MADHDPVDSPARPSGVVAVLVVDDHAPFRTAAAGVLARLHEFTVVGEAADGDEAIDAAARLRPDLVLMDVRMPRVDGLTAARTILARAPHTRVILCSTYDLTDEAAASADDPRVRFVAKEELGHSTVRELWSQLREA